MAELTWAILMLAALIFVYQVVRQKREGQLTASSFSTVFLIVLIGWITTEAVSDVTGDFLGQVGRITHFSVMILVAVTVTLQLRRSFGR